MPRIHEGIRSIRRRKTKKIKRLIANSLKVKIQISEYDGTKIFESIERDRKHSDVTKIFLTLDSYNHSYRHYFVAPKHR